MPNDLSNLRLGDIVTQTYSDGSAITGPVTEISLDPMYIKINIATNPYTPWCIIVPAQDSNITSHTRPVPEAQPPTETQWDELLRLRTDLATETRLSAQLRDDRVRLSSALEIANLDLQKAREEKAGAMHQRHEARLERDTARDEVRRLRRVIDEIGISIFPQPSYPACDHPLHSDAAHGRIGLTTANPPRWEPCPGANAPKD